MNTKKLNKPILTIIILISVLTLNFFAIDTVNAQGVQAYAIGTGTTNYGAMVGSVTALAVGYGLQTYHDMKIVELWGYRSSVQWSGDIIVSIYSGAQNDQPQSPIISSAYPYNSLPTTPSTIVFAFDNNTLAGGDHWIMIEWSSPPPAGVSTSWAITPTSQTNLSPLVYGKTMFKTSGVWVTETGGMLNFRVNAQITDAPIPTPTPTAGPTTPPTPTPTPPPPPTDAYAYVQATITDVTELYPISLGSSTRSVGSQFYTQDYINVLKLSINGYRVGTLTNGVLSAQIYDYDGVNIGSIVAESTNSYTFNTLSTSASNIDFTFNTNLLDNQQYIVVISVTGTGTGVFYIKSQDTDSWGQTARLRSTGMNFYNIPTGTSANRFQMIFSLYGVIGTAPTPTPTPSPTPDVTPPPAGTVIDQNTFPDASNKLSIATGSPAVTTANAAILQPFTANGKYITSVTINTNRLGTLPFNGEFVAGIATAASNSSYNLISTSTPIIFNLISTVTNELTFYFDGTVLLESGVEYWLVIAANNNGLSNLDDTPPCLFVVVQNTTDANNLAVFRGGQVVSSSDPALKLWYVIRGVDSPLPTPTVPPVITPSPNPQDPVPNPVWTWSIDTSPLWQPLLAWDFAGFILGCWTYSLGGSFFYILVLIISIALYIRYQNLTVLIVLWFIVGSLYAALIPLAGPVGISFIIFGFAGLLYKALAEPKT